MAQTPLFDRDYPLIVRRKLAVAIGLSEAIILQQLLYLLSHESNGKVLNDGHRYIFNTYEQWQRQYFEFMSVGHIKRCFLALEKMGFVISKQAEGRKSRRKYYRAAEGGLCHLTVERLEEAQKDAKKKLKREDRLKLFPSPPSAQIAPIRNGAKRAVPYKSEITAEITLGEDEPRDVRLTALASLTSSNLNEANWPLAGKALKAIVKLTPTVTAEEITRRAHNYGTLFSYPITPSALAKWWGKCATAKGEPPPKEKPKLRDIWDNGVIVTKAVSEIEGARREGDRYFFANGDEWIDPNGFDVRHLHEDAK